MGEYVFGTFLGPFNFLEEPYVRVAAGDFKESFEEMGEQAVYQYLCIINPWVDSLFPMVK